MEKGKGLDMTMVVRKSKKIRRWKFSFIRNWGTFNMGIEWRYSAATFGVGLGPFLFTVERLERSNEDE